MNALAKVPVTVVTGFLGAGKTTMIRHLLEGAHGRRLALIINEFGDVGVDGDILRSCGIASCPEENIVELANGCLCCTVADDFVPAIEALLAREPRPDHIVVETSGLALPKPLVKAFDWPAIRSRVTVDGVVAVVDGAAVAEGRFADDPAKLAAQRQADGAVDHDNPLEEVYEDQLLCADLIVLNKADLLSAERLDAVSAEIRAAVPRAVKVVPTREGRIDADVLLGHRCRRRGRPRQSPVPPRRRGRPRPRRLRQLRARRAAAVGPRRLRGRSSPVSRSATACCAPRGSWPWRRPADAAARAGRRLALPAAASTAPWAPGEARRGRLVIIGEKGIRPRGNRGRHRRVTAGISSSDASAAPQRQERSIAAPAAVDLAQTPADVVVLSFSDGDLAALAAAVEGVDDDPEPAARRR